MLHRTDAPTLLYRPGLPDEQAFAVDRALIIGRDEACDVWILHKSLSRRHARLEPAEDGLFLVDLQSKNGTFVQGARITRQEVRPGDSIVLGEIQLTLVAAATDRGAAIAAQPVQAAEDPTLVEAGGARRDGGPPGQPATSRRPEDAQPTAIKAFSTLSFQELLHAPGGSGALKVKHDDERQRTQDKLRILLEVSKLLSVPEDVDAVLHKIFDLAFQILDIDRAAILLADPRTGRLQPRVAKSLRQRGEPGQVYSQHIVDYVAAQSVAALFSDAAADPRLDPSQSILHQSIRASMCAPLKPKDDLIGVLYVDNQTVPNRFSAEDLDFLAAFASHAAVAIESSILYRRIEEEAVSRMRLIMEAKLSALGAVVAGIAHEVNNPLNFITNFADLSVGLVTDLEATLEGERGRLSSGVAVEVEESLRALRMNMAKISEHGRRAHAIVTSMSQHSRGTSGERELSDLNAAVAQSIRIARDEVIPTGFEIELDETYDDAAGPVELVSTDICRVFVNIVNNAFYAMRQKARAAGPLYAPRLTVRTADRGDQVEVRVRDNGTGVAPEVADKIFNPFFTTKPPGEGTGLGLSLSYEIITQGHQGTMRLESAPGEHAELIVTLPKRAASHAGTPSAV